MESFYFQKKMILIGLLYKCFIENLYNFPNHFIRVCKQDVLNIESIVYAHEFIGVDLANPSTIDLSKLISLGELLFNRIY